MAVAVPTVLARTTEEYAERLARAASLATRVHLDVSDGKFTPEPTIGLAQMYPPDQPRDLDIHLMVQRPSEHLETALSLNPDLIIIHAECYDAPASIIERVHAMGVRVGLALLPDTKVESVDDNLIKAVDHVLVFTGTLGQNGGAFNAEPLIKAKQLKAIKPDLEVSVDGGVTAANARTLLAAGVDVAYIGNAIHTAADPALAYHTLTEAFGS